MSPRQKLISGSAITALACSVVAVIFTIGSIPYKAGSLNERVTVCESKFDKIDKAVEDIAYIRGWVDSQKETE